jgi:aryl-alcohol dehydrogenase-like predicted oxidoreductase
MLTAAQQDDVWDVMMVGFNLLNQTARARVFPHTQAKHIGVLCMFAVRRALTGHAAAAELIAQLAAKHQLDLRGRHPGQVLQFLTERGVASSLPEAAYRYCRYEPGIHVVLSGTGSLAHLEENVRSLHLPPLPAEVVAQVNELFARVDSVTGN